MKKIIALILILGSAQSFARDLNTDDEAQLLKIGAGTLTALKDIDIAPNATSTKVGDCVLITNEAPYARVLSTGASLVFMGSKLSHVNQLDQHVYFNNMYLRGRKSIERIKCPESSVPTIGAFKDTLAGLFALTLNEPVEIE